MLKFNFFTFSSTSTSAFLPFHGDSSVTNRHRHLSQLCVIKMAILIILTNLLLVNKSNAGLSESLQNNLFNYNQSYERVTKPKIIKETPARLWIHMRKDDQSALAKDVYQLTSTIKLNGLSIEQKSLQIVKTGPDNSQLRFFKNTDKSNAQYLISQLRKLVPSIEIVDLSEKYNSVSWIKNGHFEIWLSLEVNSEN